MRAAQKRLERTARESTSAGNADFYDSFLRLTPEQRRALLDRVEVFDAMLPVGEVQPLLERAVRKSVKPQRRSALVIRLRGWWHGGAITHRPVRPDTADGGLERPASPRG